MNQNKTTQYEPMLGDVIGVKPEHNVDGRWTNHTGLIVAKVDDICSIQWTPELPNQSGPVRATVAEVQYGAYLISRHEVSIAKDAPHDCRYHLEFAKGFRFDYHFCKVCGSKRDAA